MINSTTSTSTSSPLSNTASIDTRINETRMREFSDVMMAQSDGDKGPDLAPPPGDRETARMFGARIAKAALRWGRG